MWVIFIIIILLSFFVYSTVEQVYVMATFLFLIDIQWALMLLKISNLLLAKMAVVVSCLHVCWTNKTIFGMQTINAPNDCPPSPSAAVSTCVCVHL